MKAQVGEEVRWGRKRRTNQKAGERRRKQKSEEKGKSAFSLIKTYEE
jgi:hypothetical protein